MRGDKPSSVLDIDSFVDWYLVNELACNEEPQFPKSCFLYLKNGRLYAGPVWDFDLAFENDDRTYPIMNNSDWIFNSKGSTTGYMKQLVNQIIKDATGKAEMKAIWGKTREKDLTAEKFNAYIEAQAQMLQESQQLNFIRWPIMNTLVHQNPRTWGSYEAEVENVKLLSPTKS